MLTLISPAKTLNEKIRLQTPAISIPEFLPEAEILINVLKKYPPSKLMKLMDINPKLAELNAGRYHRWSLPFTPDNAKPALLMFNGEVYNGLKAATLSSKELEYSQKHLRILSGLYGIICPLDIIQAYRLEMGTKLKVARKKDLYAFWGDKITDTINRELADHKQKVLLNLASNEYFAAINPKKINARILSCTFKEERNGKYQFVTIFGKKARGLMTRFIIQSRIDKAEDLKHFEEEGYFFNERISKEDEWVFTR
jgi:cytoplasmic iron level regulating protein YaaA (DUF328/UPF0246 family)